MSQIEPGSRHAFESVPSATIARSYDASEDPQSWLGSSVALPECRCKSVSKLTVSKLVVTGSKRHSAMREVLQLCALVRICALRIEPRFRWKKPKRTRERRRSGKRDGHL